MVHCVVRGNDVGAVFLLRLCGRRSGPFRQARLSVQWLPWRRRGADGTGDFTGDEGATAQLTIAITAPPDLAGFDLAGVDLAGADLATPDLAGPTPDLAGPTPDAAMRPRTDEPRWVCGCRLGSKRNGPGALPSLCLTLIAMT